MLRQLPILLLGKFCSCILIVGGHIDACIVHIVASCLCLLFCLPSYKLNVKTFDFIAFDSFPAEQRADLRHEFIIYHIFEGMVLAVVK